MHFCILFVHLSQPNHLFYQRVISCNLCDTFLVDHIQPAVADICRVELIANHDCRNNRRAHARFARIRVRLRKQMFICISDCLTEHGHRLALLGFCYVFHNLFNCEARSIISSRMASHTVCYQK